MAWLNIDCMKALPLGEQGYVNDSVLVSSIASVTLGEAV